ncbi:Uncharacterized integral membrane protein (plasmid) [Legionella adelaidensis]|uniref:Uncharacterized integral membrane protein n=1 Tax=Legionella adelaidensis TaxID=45056 RepID=A0A0W0R544_9GAMM|nr:LapA family protein [Legionella adelaidensis]KTC66212.1 hypothetical protein Lade_0870 [Legionella adelaidensis]VEH81114.1 Uncharacterized integral membrane protein [Legionella adelaidensis]
MRIVMLFFYLLLVLVGVSFAALNAMSVKINFYVTTITMPISVLMIITLGIGVLIGYSLFLGKQWRLKAENRRIKMQLKLTEKEIKNLRAIPLQD